MARLPFILPGEGDLDNPETDEDFPGLDGSLLPSIGDVAIVDVDGGVPCMDLWLQRMLQQVCMTYQ